MKNAKKNISVYCPDCLEGWFGEKEQVGEPCVYCGEGIVEKGEPKLPSTPDEVFDLAKQIFQVTSNFNLAGWLLPDGSLLAFTYGGGERSIDHGEVSRLFEAPIERWEAVNRFRDMGAIRVKPYKNSGYGIEMSVFPTQEQFEKIRQLTETANEIELEIFSNGKFFREYPYGTSMERIYRDIRNVFAGKQPSELSKFYNSKSWYKSASAIPRGTFEPLENIIKRVSSSLKEDMNVHEAFREIMIVLRPLSNFRNIIASVDREANSVMFVDNKNEEACDLIFEDGKWNVESARFERLDELEKVASSMKVNHGRKYYDHNRDYLG